MSWPGALTGKSEADYSLIEIDSKRNSEDTSVARHPGSSHSEGRRPAAAARRRRGPANPAADRRGDGRQLRVAVSSSPSPGRKRLAGRAVASLGSESPGQILRAHPDRTEATGPRRKRMAPRRGGRERRVKVHVARSIP